MRHILEEVSCRLDALISAGRAGVRIRHNSTTMDAKSWSRRGAKVRGLQLYVLNPTSRAYV